MSERKDFSEELRRRTRLENSVNIIIIIMLLLLLLEIECNFGKLVSDIKKNLVMGVFTERT